MKSTYLNRLSAIRYRLHAALIALFCIMLPQIALAKTIYVDNQLPNDCPGNYSIANRACSGTDGSAYNTPQEAADVVQPGDTVYFRGGTYQDVCAYNVCTYITIKNSGTAETPITFQNYNNEKVIIKGLGFQDAPVDDPAWRGNPITSQEYLIVVKANYIHIRGLELTDSVTAGITLEGSYNLIEECVAHDNWMTHFGIGGRILNDAEGNIFRNLEGYRSRHGSGFGMGPSTTVINAQGQQVLHYYRNNLIEDCLFYNNGRNADLTEVHIVSGDSDGGGNSDAASSSKNCFDMANNPSYPVTMGVDSWCPNNTYRGIIGFGNGDDGLDVSLSDSLIENNIVFSNGPNGNRGYKVFHSNAFNMSFRGNVAFGNNDFNMRGSNNSYYNNLGLYSLMGFTPVAHNNLAELNASISCAGDCTNNWDVGINGSAGLVDLTFMFENDPYMQKVSYEGIPDTFRLNFPEGWSVAQKVAYIKDKVRIAFSPIVGSPLIDAGTIIPGYHSPYADDDSVNPMDPEAPGRHWRGLAPDIGAYEYVPPSGAFLYGDVSGDREIGAYDAALTAQAAVGLLTLTPEQTQKADVSGDGEVGAYDAALIAQWTVGLISKFPVEN